MVVTLIKWRHQRPPSKKFEAKIAVRRLQGLSHLPDCSKISVEVKWKGPPSKPFTALRRVVRRNFTKEESLADGAVHWDNEEFHCVCTLSSSKDGRFHPWEVSFGVFSGMKQQQRTNSNVSLVAAATLNLAEYASSSEREIDFPMAVPPGEGVDSGGVTVNLSITLSEIKNSGEPLESIIPRRTTILSFPRSPCYGEMFTSKKAGDVSSAQKPGPKRVNILKGLTGLRGKKRMGQAEESSDGKSSMTEDKDFNYPFDTDSPVSSDEEVSEEGVTEGDSNVRKSFGYGTLAYANRARDVISSNTSGSEDDDWVYYSHCRSDDKVSDSERLVERDSKRRLLPWRKRKSSFSSLKEKSEPLLKRYYGEEGGDDIDFDRRQLSSSDESNFMLRPWMLRQLKPDDDFVSNPSLSSAFGEDDDFAVGKWEPKEITDRDGRMKLKAQVFFASIDQRSERAAGESACTALVAVIADWLNSNHRHMPIKSQIDGLIREGSLQWRTMCENEAYMERFPDKHFDLETVLEAKVRPLRLVPEKSFVGFFHPSGFEGEGFDFLRGAMSFDGIWDEISPAGGGGGDGYPAVYVVSWNDHFFVLKVDRDAYYIVDTLGERLYEGCDQAFVLKFDEETIIERVANDDRAKSVEPAERAEEEDGSAIVCSGKESCKEYIKSFLAAIPIRELQADVKKGLVTTSSAPLHRRLQIEFHYTSLTGDLGERSDQERRERLCYYQR